jgi:hypothetical protein
MSPLVRLKSPPTVALLETFRVTQLIVETLMVLPTIPVPPLAGTKYDEFSDALVEVGTNVPLILKGARECFFFLVIR